MGSVALASDCIGSMTAALTTSSIINTLKVFSLDLVMLVALAFVVMVLVVLALLFVLAFFCFGSSFAVLGFVAEK